MPDAHWSLQSVLALIPRAQRRCAIVSLRCWPSAAALSSGAGCSIVRSMILPTAHWRGAILLLWLPVSTAGNRLPCD